jgi:hypothetical protein
MENTVLFNWYAYKQTIYVDQQTYHEMMVDFHI